jgi:hypothetical protein
MLTFAVYLQNEFVKAIVGFKSRIVHADRVTLSRPYRLLRAGDLLPAIFLYLMQIFANNAVNFSYALAF